MSDSSSGYHEDYETSDGEPIDTTIPDVIMEVDGSTRLELLLSSVVNLSFITRWSLQGVAGMIFLLYMSCHTSKTFSRKLFFTILTTAVKDLF